MPPQRALSVRKKLLFAAAATLAGLLLLEGACRLYLAMRPDPTARFRVAEGVVDSKWFDILDQDMHTQDPAVELYEKSPDLFWRLRPNTTATVVNVVYETRGEPATWRITINSEGHRGRPYPAAGGASPTVVCLGDSCTFGFRVSDDETWPAQLRTCLRQEASPDAEVINYGVPGYSSYQGRVLLERVLQQHSPDVVVLGFGANDLEKDRLSDAEKGRRTVLPVLEAPGLVDHLAIARVLRGDPAARRTEARRVGSATRVSPSEYRENLEAMIRMAQERGCRVILLDLVFIGPHFRDTIASVAAEHQLPWLDGRAALESALSDLMEGRRFQSEKDELDRFWNDRVLGYRGVYYSEQFYQQIFADAVWSKLLRYFLVEPVHANPLGNRVLAEQIGRLISELPVK